MITEDGPLARMGAGIVQRNRETEFPRWRLR